MKIDADPAAVRQDVVRFSAPGADKHVSNFPWKRDINQAVAVHVTYLTATDGKFNPAKAVGRDLNSVPVTH